MKLWNYEIMKLWNYEITKLWNYEIMKLWNYEIVKLWNINCLLLESNLRQSCCESNQQFWRDICSQRRCLDSWISGSIAKARRRPAKSTWRAGSPRVRCNKSRKWRESRLIRHLRGRKRRARGWQLNVHRQRPRRQSARLFLIRKEILDCNKVGHKPIIFRKRSPIWRFWLKFILLPKHLNNKVTKIKIK